MSAPDTAPSESDAVYHRESLAQLEKWVPWDDLRGAFRDFLGHVDRPFRPLRKSLRQDYPVVVYIHKRAFPPARYFCPRVLLAADGEVVNKEAGAFLDGRIGDYGAAADYPQVYVPNWSVLLNLMPLARPLQSHQLDALLRAKKHFCALVQHETSWPLRQEFYELLSRARFVHSLGDGLRNRPSAGRLRPRFHPHVYGSLARAYRPYKFALTFENASSLGYISEKIFCALLSRAVPIYWGDPMIADILHPGCFINAHDFATPQALVAHVLKVDADAHLYRQYLAAPVFRKNALPACARADRQAQNLQALVRRLRKPDYCPKAVRDMFQRDILSRLKQGHVRHIAPAIRSAAFARPQIWHRPRELAARRAAVRADPAWRGEPDLL